MERMLYWNEQTSRYRRHRDVRHEFGHEGPHLD